MAIRRAKQKEQVIAKLSAQAPAGEQFIACVHAQTGPNPYLDAFFAIVPLIGIIVTLPRRYYFFTLTSTSVIVNTANRFTNRPGEVVAVFPRHSFPVSNYEFGVGDWSKFYVQFPDSPKPTRLNVSSYWRKEFDRLASVFPDAPPS